MNMISSTYIRDYLLKKFQGKFKLISGDREMTIPSLFVDHDPKRHMSINLDSGLWQCFKSGKKGNFIHLYGILENLGYSQAYQKFLIDDFFAEEEFKVLREDYNKNTQTEHIPEDFIEVTTNDTNPVNSQALLYLIDRGLYDYGTFYYSLNNTYKNRLIIPYMNQDKMFYFQARALYPNQQPKYLNFRGMKSSAILFPFSYASKNPLYICEGAFDAMSLQMLGHNATTTISCHVSRQQLEQLKFYQGPIVVAYDNDKAGRDGLRNFEIMRRKMRLPKISYVFPPQGYKDWNEAFVTNPDVIYQTLQEVKTFDLNEWDTTAELDTFDPKQ